jgi:Flp pilus assembly protein TadD
VLTWPGCAQPLFNRHLADISSGIPPHVSGPESQEGPVSLARLVERSGQTEQAQRMYLTLIEKQPDNPLPYHRLGVMAAQEKKWRVAEQFFNQAYALNPSSTELLSDMGYFYYLQNRHQEAENILRQALALDADDKAANNNLGLVLGDQKRFDESFNVFRQAGTDAEARANLAFVLAQQGRYDQALETYSNALSLDRKLRPAAMAMLQLAQHRPKPAAGDPPTNSPQLAAKPEVASPKDDDEVMLASAAAVEISDLPARPAASLPQANTRAKAPPTQDVPVRAATNIESGVVIADQPEPVAPRRSPKLARQNVDIVVPSHKPTGGTSLAIDIIEVVEQCTRQLATEAERNAAEVRSENKSQRPEIVAEKAASLPATKTDQQLILQPPGNQGMVATTQLSKNHGEPTRTVSTSSALTASETPMLPSLKAMQPITPAVVARVSDGPSNGGNVVHDGEIAPAKRPRARVRSNRTPDLATRNEVGDRRESPNEVLPAIALEISPTPSVKTPEISAKLSRLGIEP